MIEALLLVAFTGLVIFLLLRCLSEEKREKGISLLAKICGEINNLAPQYGLPSIRLIRILPLLGERYPTEFYVERVRSPFKIYWEAQDFDDEFRMGQKIWCTYLKFVLRWRLIRRYNAFLEMGDWCGYNWYIEIEFSETKTALELEFYGEQRDESKLILSAINRALLESETAILAEGKWDDLLPQFLHWYCVFQRSDPEELRRAAELMLL
jgi:hypothetical protein